MGPPLRAEGLTQRPVPAAVRGSRRLETAAATHRRQHARSATGRAAPSTGLVETMQAQHHRVDEYAEQVAPLLAAWEKDPVSATSRKALRFWISIYEFLMGMQYIKIINLSYQNHKPIISHADRIFPQRRGKFHGRTDIV